MNLFWWKIFAILQKILLEKNNSVTNSLLFWKIEQPKNLKSNFFCQNTWLSSELLKHYCFTDYLFIYLFFPPLIFQAYLGRLVGGSNPVNCSSQAKPSQAKQHSFATASNEVCGCTVAAIAPVARKKRAAHGCSTGFACASETRRRG